MFYPFTLKNNLSSSWCGNFLISFWPGGKIERGTGEAFEGCQSLSSLRFPASLASSSKWVGEPGQSLSAFSKSLASMPSDVESNWAPSLKNYVNIVSLPIWIINAVHCHHCPMSFSDSQKIVSTRTFLFIIVRMLIFIEPHGFPAAAEPGGSDGGVSTPASWDQSHLETPRHCTHLQFVFIGMVIICSGPSSDWHNILNSFILPDTNLTVFSTRAMQKKNEDIWWCSYFCIAGHNFPRRPLHLWSKWKP